MVRKLLALLLVFLLAVPSGALAAAKPNSKKIAKIKAKVQKYAATQEPVTVMLDDEKRTELKGTIAEAGDDGFVLAGHKPATSRHLAYGEVSGVWGKGMSGWAKLGIGVGALVGVFLGLYALARASSG